MAAGTDGSAESEGGTYGLSTAIGGANWNAISRAFGPDMAPPTGASLIRAFESCRLSAYQDSTGRWTIGWGETGPDIVAGTVWSQELADASFTARLTTLQDSLEQHVLAVLRPGQLAALLSLAWNVGLAAVVSSYLLRMVNQRSWLAAAHEFPRWDHVGGTEEAGLLHRRLAEALVFVADSRG